MTPALEAERVLRSAWPTDREIGYTRRFSRDFGIAPHSLQVVARLSEASRLLRGGADIAQTAAETGFTDQSHLGRHFPSFKAPA